MAKSPQDKQGTIDQGALSEHLDKLRSQLDQEVQRAQKTLSGGQVGVRDLLRISRVIDSMERAVSIQDAEAATWGAAA